MINKDDLGLYHPANASEISDLIKYAISKNLTVRVRGAAQSVPESIIDRKPNGSSDEDCIFMQLDKIRHIEIDRTHHVATVGAGVNLAYDPYDPSCTSNRLNGLYRTINHHGLALPNVPDAAHQTVGGYLSTGSSGATMKHSFEECILNIKMVDGHGNLVEFAKSDDMDDDFYGIVASIGLLGIIYEVSLQCVPRFDIVGSEHIADAAGSPYNLFGSNQKSKPTLKEYFTDQEYTRTLWWPYQTLHRTITWQARKMDKEDYNHTTGQGEHFHPKPYVPVFPKILGSRYPAELLASTLFKFISSWPDWIYPLLKIDPSQPNPQLQGIIEIVNGMSPDLYPLMIDMYFPVNSDSNPPQQFWDHWLGSLPMDTLEFSNTLMNLDYSEFWFDIEHCQEVIDTLKEYYDKGGVAATGIYTVELLPAKRSNFWLSPGYGRNSFRLNFMRFAGEAGSPDEFYYQYYQLFQEKGIPFRLHWGKHMPDQQLDKWSAYLRQQYPKYDNFRQLREKMDPHSIFLTTYWKNHLLGH